MKNILYYVTDHGRGHATRSVAIIRELQKQHINVIIRNSNLLNFFQKSLPGITVYSGITDVGPTMNSDGISIDENKSKSNIHKWISSFPKLINNELELVSKTNPNLIISDISIMPFLISKYLQIQSIAISNFSWYDSLKFLNSHDLEILKNTYDYADFCIQLPLGTNMGHFTHKQKTGFAVRIPKKSKLEIRNKLGIKMSDTVVLFVLGTNQIFTCTAEDNVVFLSAHSKFLNSKNYICYDDWIEGQELIAASDLVICKCGYGVISECLTNGIPFFYVMNEDHIEQKAISEQLLKLNLYNKITFKQINDLHFNSDFFESLKLLEKSSNDNYKIVEYIKEFLNK
jgi:UDP:flavonoid glycosyltransferase YjiC (YdhE family)